MRVAAIDGDDLLPRVDELRAAGIRDMFSDAPFPECEITSCNAYLGALPIAEALSRGADIVVTGRVVDSALVLGPLIHEFGWKSDDYDRLAAGTAAGHLLECGAQVSGGTFTDWRDVPNWSDAGFPIGECHADGTIVITKPTGSGGLVSVGTVAEQLLYEVGDPQAYLVPDVTCDFSGIALKDVGPNRVEVSAEQEGIRRRQRTKCVCPTMTAIAALPISPSSAPRRSPRQSVNRRRSSIASIACCAIAIWGRSRNQRSRFWGAKPISARMGAPAMRAK